MGLVETEPVPAKELGGVKVQRVSERTDWVKMLIYGVPGAGKTYLAGQAATIERMSPVLFIDIEEIGRAHV